MNNMEQETVEFDGEFDYKEYVQSLGEINIDDYVFAEEENEFMKMSNLLNIFTCYFKQLFSREAYSTMFENVDLDKNANTNRCMEFLYEEINKFNNSAEEDKSNLYGPDDDVNMEQCKELYTLYVKDEPIFLCKYLLPIFEYLATIEWNVVDWSIIPIKTLKN
jgi:hypothetical protein